MSTSQPLVRMVGRYAIYDEIASGGMATVFYGRLRGPVGFSRPVAIKRLHPHLAKEPDFVAMLIDEALLVAHIQHPNVVQTLDVVEEPDGVYLVMQYVQGETLARLLRKLGRTDERIPAPVVCSIVAGVLNGLHAAHEATDERGEKLGIVHRDVSPQNVIVGLDGTARLLDFGVAKAAGRTQTTRQGQLKGKLSYMAPEQVRGDKIDRRTDIYAASVVFWEMLTGRRLFGSDNEANIIERVLNAHVDPPSSLVPGLPPGIDAVVLRGLQRNPSKRFGSAREMAREIERVSALASNTEVGEWVDSVAGDDLSAQSKRLSEAESHSGLRTPSRASLPDTSEIPVESEDGPIVLKDSTSASFSMADTNQLATYRSRRTRLYVAGAGALLLGVFVAAFALSRPAAAPEAAAGAPGSAAAAAPADEPTAPPAAATDITATTPPTGAGTSTPAPPPVAVAPPPRPVARPLQRPTGIVRPYPTEAAPAKKPGCNPPYTIDKDGVKNYKPECL